MLKTLEIKGYRGFVNTQTLNLATPNGNNGSGLTIVVGANNSGKSTIVESIRALIQNNNPSFNQSHRNILAGDFVQMRLTDTNNAYKKLQSLRAGTSETVISQTLEGNSLSKILVLPSRRTFSPFFSKVESDRTVYISQIGFPSIRSSVMDEFTRRLFVADRNKEAFNKILSRVLNPVPNWTIDQSEQGSHFLKFIKGQTRHSSEGLGEGLISLFYIIDALYDSTKGDTIVIDEPELSLHPSLQRKLSSLLVEYAADRQIILSTHSPYFINLDALKFGSTIARVYLKDEISTISQISTDSAKWISRVRKNINNPHIFGLNAQEVFFLEDKVILVEGQEDVIFYNIIMNLLGLHLEGTFFGWGVGGADNMDKVAQILEELGFEKIVGILDGNKAHLIEPLKKRFPKFHFYAIPADDVRTKEAIPAKEKVNGLLDRHNKTLRPKYRDSILQMFDKVNQFLHD